MRLIVAIVLGSLVAPQSLADLAAREKERRERMRTERPDGASYSNTDLGDGPGWRRFTPEDGHFSIDLPDKPSREVGTEPLPGGREARRVTYRARDVDGVEFLVSYLDFPADLLATSPEYPSLYFNRYETARYRVSRGALYGSTIAVEGRRGSFYYGGRVQFAGVQAGFRLYEMSVLAPEPQPLEPHAFFHSLAINSARMGLAPAR